MPSETPISAEAIRRLTPSEYYERLFRIRRALNLSMKKMELSKDQWTTKEQVLLLLSFYSILGCSLFTTYC